MANFDKYKKYKWSVVAEDYNSPLLRNYIWTGSIHKYPELFDLPAFPVGIVSRKNKISYIADIEMWGRTSKIFSEKIHSNLKLVSEYIDKTNAIGEQTNCWSEKNIFNNNLKDLTDAQLLNLLDELVERMRTLYSYGILLPTLDFQGFSFVEGNLKKYLESKVSKEDYSKYFDVFTFPENKSFSQEQDEELLKILVKYNTLGFKDVVINGSVNDIKQKLPEFWLDLNSHADKWGWVYYVYAGPVFGTNQFIDFAKSFLKDNVDPAGKLKLIREHRSKVKKEKNDFIEILQPNEFHRTIIDLAGKVVWAKPRRKDYQSKTYFHAEKLLKEIGIRLNITLDEARSLPPPIIKDLIVGGKKCDVRYVSEFYNNHMCLPGSDCQVECFKSEEVNDFVDNFIEKQKTEIDDNVTELRGSVARPGHARGLVSIINKPEDMTKMASGNILVSVATTPSVVPAMKKASAIISDEGGLTCHAAIVSRELGIPCVVGTKIATKVLKDGDLVEVDAERGVVTIIERRK